MQFSGLSFRVHFINHFKIMTLFYAPPWRAFLYTIYLIIYVSLSLSGT